MKSIMVQYTIDIHLTSINNYKMQHKRCVYYNILCTVWLDGNSTNLWHIISCIRSFIIRSTKYLPLVCDNDPVGTQLCCIRKWSYRNRTIPSTRCNTHQGLVKSYGIDKLSLSILMETRNNILGFSMVPCFKCLKSKDESTQPQV